MRGLCISQGPSGKLETDGRCTDIQKEIYSRVLASVITETEKSRDLPSTSWGPRTERTFALPPPLCSIQAFDGLGDAHPHWEGQQLYFLLIPC